MENYEERLDWFESVYASTDTGFNSIPWAKLKTNEALDLYLKSNPTKGKALVIGCGLGDDARALESMGFEVVAIDISSSALELAKQRFPNSQISFELQDIFKMPEKSKQSFDFIFEAFTIQSLPRSYRNEMISSIVSLLKTDGKLLVVAHSNEDKTKLDGPPWPLSKKEFFTFKELGLDEVFFESFADNSSVSPVKYKALYEFV